jgi:fructose-1,6-bisphosphatase/inositol monophosphatase family enzyme
MVAEMFKEQDFNFFKTLIREAGALATSIQGGVIEVTRKDDASIVTQADMAVQDLLERNISSRYGGVRFIHEENYHCDGSILADEALSVVIDPIDGTAMYSMYLPVWCVSIGVFQGAVPRYGFVYSPGFNMLFHNDDEHAYMNDQVRRVNEALPIDRETNIFYASEAHDDYSIVFPGKVRNLGSTALHACLTVDNARNRTLAFIGRSHLWDWAGAIPIIQKAGGHVRYISGNDVQYREIVRNGCKLPDYLVAYAHKDFAVIQNIFRRKKSAG